MSLFEKARRVFQASDGKEHTLGPAFQYHDAHLPTLWLLGKTGAGKSTLVQSITGNTQAEIGKGFQPCTQTSTKFGFPVVKPVFQFLDTRGLGESGYDATEDIEVCTRQGHALILVMKLGDTEQRDVLSAIRQIKSSKKIVNYLLVHTASQSVSDLHERQRLVQYNCAQVHKILGREVPSVLVDFKLPGGGVDGMEDLVHALSAMLPIISVLLKKQQCSDEEVRKFQELQTQVLWYSGVAGVSDIVPGIGLVAVPGIQWKMLRDMADSYNMNWNKAALAELLGALGAGIGVRYSMKFGTRQVVKFLPAWGQTLGAASAAVMSFCTTYAIGRVACKFMYHKNHEEDVSDEELRVLFHSAFDSVKTLARQELTGSGDSADRFNHETVVVAGASEVETSERGE